VKITFIFIAYSALFILGIIDNSRGPIYPEILQLFLITKSQGSLIFSLASLSGFIISLFSRKWIPFFGVMGATRISLLLDAISCLLMGTVSVNHFGYYQFLVAAIILGLAMGIKGITLNVMINQSSPARLRRQLYAGLHSMYGIASLSAPLIFGYIFKNNISWKDYFLYLSLLPIFILILSLKEKTKKRNEYTEKDNHTQFNKAVWYALAFTLYVSSEILISSRLVVYLTESHEISKADASYLLSGFFTFLLIGRLFFTFMKVNINSYNLMRLSLILSILINLLGLSHYPKILILNGLTMSFFFPTGMDFLSTRFSKASDSIISIVMISVGGGLVVTHYLFGLLSDSIGVASSMWLTPIMLTISLYLLQFKLKNPN